MLIECDTCAVRGKGCDHCVIAELLGAPQETGTGSTRPEPIAWEPTEPELSEWDLDAAERRALHVLAMAGLIAPASQPPVLGIVERPAKGGLPGVERAS